MKKIVLTIVLFLPIILFSQSNKEQKNILMVVSSYGKDNGSIRPGYEFDEFSQAYLVFKNNNFSVNVASPKGGKVEADKFNTEKTYNKTLLEDKEALSLLDHTMTTVDVNPEDYDAIYIVGGKGAMFDLPFDPSLQDIVLNLYERKGTVISSVCHGPASFVNIKSNDEFIIKGVELTSFCNIEEELFGKKWVKEFPFSLETKLEERGAIFKQADFMLSKVVVSGKFVTGQNPFSTAKSAEAVVKSFGVTPVKRELYDDENSVYLIQDILDNKIKIEKAESLLAKNIENYDIPLIAVWGYYKTIAAKENKAELKKAMEIMELTSPHFFDQNLEFVLARTHYSLGNNQKAKKILNDLISKNLLKEKAEKLLKEIK
jgi:putative intracellular protease/amidase